MRNAPLETVSIDADNRVLLYPTLYATDLEEVIGELGNDRGVYVFPKPRSYGVDRGALDVSYLLACVEDEFGDLAFQLPDGVAEIESRLSASIREEGFLSAFADVTGYSQGDYWRVIIYIREGVADDPMAVMKSMLDSVLIWLRNDIYEAAHETRDTWTNSKGETRELWTEVDRLGCITPEFANDIYPSASTLAELFEIAFDAEPEGDH